jgi:hypothetical protein
MTKTLHGLRVPRVTINLDDSQSFEVRGIGASDLMLLTTKHGAVLSLIFGRIMKDREEGGRVTDEAIKKVLVQSASEFPDLASNIIALASDSFDDEGIKIAKSIPLPIQVEALEAIFALTFSSEAAVKKMLESLTRMAMAASGALTGVRLSPTGTGEFVAA